MFIGRVGNAKHLLVDSFSVQTINLVTFFRLALWFGTCLMGFGNSGVYAIILAFIEQLTPVTGRITAGFSISGKLH